MIRVLIVDDEEHGRRGIANRLARHSDFQISGICENGTDAIRAIRHDAPDVVFLDIQMSDKSGFEVIEAIGADLCPIIIFVTAFDVHALKAFDIHALDYLLKPIDDERFDASVGRAREALIQRSDSRFRERLSSLVSNLKQLESFPQISMQRLCVRSGPRTVFVEIAEIDWVAATGDYVTLHVGKKEWLMRETISAIGRQLQPHGFAQIHRSTLVNLERIVELRYLDNGDYRVLLREGTELKLSRSFHATAQRLLNSKP